MKVKVAAATVALSLVSVVWPVRRVRQVVHGRSAVESLVDRGQALVQDLVHVE